MTMNAGNMRPIGYEALVTPAYHRWRARRVTRYADAIDEAIVA